MVGALVVTCPLLLCPEVVTDAGEVDDPPVVEGDEGPDDDGHVLVWV